MRDLGDADRAFGAARAASGSRRTGGRMRFTDEHTVPVARDQLFAAFEDPVALAAEVPGCTSLTRTGPGAYTATVDIEIPCVQGTYRLDVDVAQVTAPSAATLEVRAAGTPGGGRARVAVEFEIGRAAGRERVGVRESR